MYSNKPVADVLDEHVAFFIMVTEFRSGGC